MNNNIYVLFLVCESKLKFRKIDDRRTDTDKLPKFFCYESLNISLDLIISIFQLSKMKNFLFNIHS